jgi:hypothetical protein
LLFKKTHKKRSLVFLQTGDSNPDDSGVNFLAASEADEVDGVAGLKSNDVAYRLSQDCRCVIDSRPRHRRIRSESFLFVKAFKLHELGSFHFCLFCHHSSAEPHQIPQGPML